MAKCVLVESDFSGIEAVLAGWLARDPVWIRVAKLGPHSYLASHLHKRPADLSWSDEDLKAYFKEVKALSVLVYDQAKHGVYGTIYGQTPIGLVNTYPDLFTRRTAIQTQGMLYEVAPKLKQWHTDLQQFAHKHSYLGGPIPPSGEYNGELGYHPYGYRRWFWNVYNYNSKSGKWTLGDDSKAALAFPPASIAAGILYDSCLELTDPESPNYIGEMYQEKKTPIRALVHDSILSEVPSNRLEEYTEKVRAVMTREIKQLPLPAEWGMGAYLHIGCEIKAGPNWMDMEVVP